MLVTGGSTSTSGPSHSMYDSGMRDPEIPNRGVTPAPFAITQIQALKGNYKLGWIELVRRDGSGGCSFCVVLAEVIRHWAWRAVPRPSKAAAVDA